MKLSGYDNTPVRTVTVDGRAFEGLAEWYPSDYGLHVFDREEESIRLGDWHLFETDIREIERIDRERLCGFYGAESVQEEIRALYRRLRRAWCAETCAPRMRKDWSPENPTLGQCSITSFLVQDLLGGKVYGVPLKEGGYHCYNVVGEYCFDLTSEQFGDEELNYDGNPEQSRERHFADGDKLARYELLKKRFAAT